MTRRVAGPVHGRLLGILNQQFCEYTGCWIVDNRPSVYFLERGRIIKKMCQRGYVRLNSKAWRGKEEEKASKEFAAVEVAALKGY